MRRQILTGVAGAALVASLVLSPGSLAQAQMSTIAQAAGGGMKPVYLHAGSVTRRLPTISAGVRVSALEKMGQTGVAGPVRTAPTTQQPVTQPVPLSFGCKTRNYNGNTAANVRVNQDCTYRRQAEEDIEVNPNNPRNLIAGQNDSRVGYNKCGFDYSLDGGASWGDGLPPFYQHTNPDTGHTYDAASDPSLAFDAQGNAFFSCVLFDVNDNASGLMVARSPAYAQGSFYNNVPDSGPACRPGYTPGTCSPYVVAEANSPAISYDKEFINADNYATSPYRNNVYIVFTQFNFDPRCGPQPGANIYGYCSSPIFFSKSTDGGHSWTIPMDISSTNPQLCFFGNSQDPNANPNACNFDQGADIAIQPNGTIVVTFNNGNTPAGNPNGQQLAVVSKDGGNTFGPPSLVGADVVYGEPQCDFGRGPEECVPGQYARTNDFPRIDVNRTTGQLFVTWQDYRTGKFGVQMSQSSDGVNWTASNGPVVQDTTDDSQPAVAVNSISGSVSVSYYQTAQVPNENINYNLNNVYDPSQPGVQATNSTYSLSNGRGIAALYALLYTTLPFPAPDAPNQAGFIGDYSGLVYVQSTAHAIWSDTRNLMGAEQPPGHDEDVFTQTVPTP